MNYTYEQAKELLTSQGKFHINLGLERITKILELLGNPQDKLKCIHVAGTNGKGSVCAIIASVLKSAGMKTGLYSSPHIFKYTERIKILTDITPTRFSNVQTSSHIEKLPSPLERDNIPDEVFAQYVFDICDLADKNNINLTEFEILTAVMFKYFYDEKVDVVF